MQEIKKIAVLLGNENSDSEVLSEIAVLRIKTVSEFLNENREFAIIPTGSFGEHFNNSNTPHGYLLNLQLIENGIEHDRILPHTRTSNTLEDSFGVLRCVKKIPSVTDIHIVTSEFHMPRVKFIFSRVLQEYRLTFQSAPNPKPTPKLSKQIEHEKKSIDILKREWVDIANFDLLKFPDQSYENLGYELRHYDNLSYLAILGAIIIEGVFVSKKLPLTKECYYLEYIAGILFIIVFWLLYLRLATTASSARRVLTVVEKLYGVPGISSTHLRSNINLNIKSAISLLFLIGILFLLTLCLSNIFA